MSDQDLCTWSFVTCNSDGEVTDLLLMENNLKGMIPIPSEIGLMTALEVLYLHLNELSGTVPSDLGLHVLENLKEMWLWLVGNDLTGEIPDEIYVLYQLPVVALKRILVRIVRRLIDIFMLYILLRGFIGLH
eukprot:CAMPEP_0116021012 /NCGR_PEP_ID=MMETSP0321-20121206/10135_1 /TAXON_ID=163516 /ORGANISM="Leptocylindrus danicus var. danicus, Strain B650" /LENGTH=131 /DNA_ID=CAMNT_0003491805 /DNA_START=325 /DNA_END=720 /DNA_ORIENTATION=+